MRSIIEKIYEAEQPSRENIDDNENYKESLAEFIKLVDGFKTSLTENQKVIFEKLENLRDELEYETGLSRYIAAFKLGLKVGLEVSED
ncbi:MAG: hypothetical protein K2N68_02045 [Clostridia bacterium]|nr:hypothetical protein [Clostridia bacterium]MDE7214602.1 hypothetical protein [Clostridia bacterium]